MSQQRGSDRGGAKRPPASRGAPAGSTGSRRGPIALLVLAGVLTALGLVQLRLVWVNLPLPRLERLDANAVVQAFRAARSAWTGDVRSGALLAIISSHFTTALREPARLSELFEDARAGYARIAGTQLGRLQLAALGMLRLERENVPPANWWATLEPYFTGLDNASFGHFLPELLSANAAVYEQVGLAAGSARRSAQNTVGYPHGPFVEYFAEQMERVARARHDAGDPTTAATCRRLVRRLLRQWVLDPAPPAVRLLAAELLLGQLEAEPTTTAPTSTAGVVAGLRQWRAAYRDAAAQRPTPLPLLSNAYTPVPDQPAYDRLRDAVAVLLWVAPAFLVTALSAALAATIWLRHPAAARGALLGGLFGALVLVAAGLAYFQMNPTPFQDDLQRLGAPDAGWPRYPFVSAATAVFLLAVAVVGPRHGGRRWAALAAWATTMSAVLALTLVGTGLWARAATTHYEARVATLLTSGDFEAVAGPDAERQLDPLRAWNP